MKTHLYICRHGNTFLPDEPSRRVGSRTDLPLTPKGQEQAVSLGLHFKEKGIKPTLILTGPLQRTLDTALILAETAQYLAPIQIDERLKEIHYGPDENQLESAVEARLGKAALNLWETEGVIPSGWNASNETLLLQWENIGQEILNQHPGRDIILVTSNGIARFACALFGGLSALKEHGGLKLRTGAYGIITHTPEYQWQLEAWDKHPA